MRANLLYLILLVSNFLSSASRRFELRNQKFATLGTLKGSFILSINDTPEIRETFAGFRTEEVKTRYTAARRKNGQGQVTELVITSPAPAAG